jgi:hypothetical protein
MKKILFIAIATLSLVSAAGCKKKGGGAEALGKLQETADKVCAAKDLASATKAQEEYAKWSADWVKTNPSDGKAAALSDADKKAFTDATKKLSDCYTKLASAGAGSPPGTPAAGSDTAPAAGSAAAPAAGSGEAPAAGSGDKPAGSDTAPAAAGSGDKPADGAAK